METVLISEGIMCSCSIKLFRKNVAPYFLDLINRYEVDKRDPDSQRLKSQYIEDSFALRRHVEKLAQHTSEVHY